MESHDSDEDMEGDRGSNDGSSVEGAVGGYDPDEDDEEEELGEEFDFADDEMFGEDIDLKEG